jgi:NAD(P)-dependent dehydrogenase (short-subunit alcohol dehydrogenase family)
VDLAGSVAVVTGAGSGIGRALAVGFAAAGARVVAGDLSRDGVDRTVADVRARGESAVGVVADAATPAGIAEMVDAAEAAFGAVDVYVANAGIIGAPGLGSESDWDSILEVNLRGHVRAADALLPGWIERGHGYFVAVASAAGLLTQIGAAGYAVSKHAAVGFAEWLSITYGDKGIGVSCVCPMGVDTPLLNDITASDDPASRMAAAAVRNAGEVVGPERVAEATVEAVRAGTFLVLPHPVVLDMYRHKGADYDRWLAGMRRYQAGLG